VGPLELLVRGWPGWAFAGVWGALWGSFFNVAIYRVGLYESVVRPRSRCPSCGRPIAGFDNIPILSWLILGGRCRHCRARISIRYPLVEAISVGLSLAVWARFVAGRDAPPSSPIVMGPPSLLAHFFVYFAFAGTLLVLSGIDLDHQLLPDRITMPAIPVALVAGLLLGDLPPLELIVGAVIGYGVVAVTAELAYLALGREGMGYGDAKMLAMTGALLGWRGVAATFFGAPFVGLLIAVPILLARRGRLFGLEIPYGPFLALARARLSLLRPAPALADHFHPLSERERSTIDEKRPPVRRRLIAERLIAERGARPRRGAGGRCPRSPDLRSPSWPRRDPSRPMKRWPRPRPEQQGPHHSLINIRASSSSGAPI
jgi:leader peptidase (prepilin peptidase)/N-methyltransferase